MNTHPFDILALDSGASFIFTPCPGTKTFDLVTSVQQLKQAGAKAIVSLMYDEELNNNGASQLSEVCGQESVRWFQLPISDDAAPNEDFLDSWNTNLDELMLLLNNQQTIAVHCKGGSGRTGLVIALLMLQLGLDKSEVKSLVQSIRPKSLTNSEQLNYFEQFAE